jgi:N-methylhydantoinase A
MLAYGGMTPLFACTIAAGAGIRRVVVPPHSAAFSAWGVVMADRVRRYARTVSWNLDDPGHADEVNAIADGLVAQAVADARDVGLDPADLTVRRIGAFRFLGQVWEIDLPLGDERLGPDDAGRLRDRFIERYEEIYGRGTAWQGSPVILLDYEVLATIKDESRRFNPAGGGTPQPLPRGTRRVFMPGVFDDAAIGGGARLDGPALVDANDTTIFVPDGWSGERDELGNLVLTLR